MLFVLRRWREGRNLSVSPDDDDARLIERAREGDLDAFNLLVDRYQQIVYRVARRYMRSPDLADDVTQDTFIRAYNALDTFRNSDGRGFRSWLLRIATNRARDLLRASARRPADSLESMVESEDSAWEPEDRAETPSARADRLALHHHLEWALGELSDDQRLAIVLFDVEGYSYDEIAEISGAAVGTIKSRLHRARARLHQILSEHPEGRELFAGLVRLPSDAESE